MNVLGTVLSAVFLTAIPLPADASAEDPSGAGVEERLGGKIPLYLTFHDENGRVVALKELVDKPAVIVLAYLSCTNVCPLILGEVAEVIAKLKKEPGKNFTVLTISFDQKDTPLEAARKKKEYLKASVKPLPLGAWRFLTGDGESIAKLAGSLGLKFEKKEDAFVHPTALIVVSKEGRIIRYIYGKSFLPAEVEMALLDAEGERVVPAIRRIVLFCFGKDAEGRTLAFNILKLAGTATMASAAAFFIFVRKKGRFYELWQKKR